MSEKYEHFLGLAKEYDAYDLLIRIKIKITGKCMLLVVLFASLVSLRLLSIYWKKTSIYTTLFLLGFSILIIVILTTKVYDRLKNIFVMRSGLRERLFPYITFQTYDNNYTDPFYFIRLMPREPKLSFKFKKLANAYIYNLLRNANESKPSKNEFFMYYLFYCLLSAPLWYYLVPVYMSQEIFTVIIALILELFIIPYILFRYFIHPLLEISYWLVTNISSHLADILILGQKEEKGIPLEESGKLILIPSNICILINPYAPDKMGGIKGIIELHLMIRLISFLYRSMLLILIFLYTSAFSQTMFIMEQTIVLLSVVVIGIIPIIWSEKTFYSILTNNITNFIRKKADEEIARLYSIYYELQKKKRNVEKILEVIQRRDRNTKIPQELRPYIIQMYRNYIDKIQWVLQQITFLSDVPRPLSKVILSDWKYYVSIILQICLGPIVSYLL